jgi:hypothetical protein
VQEPASARPAQGPLMVGPDNAVYIIAKNENAINQIADPAGSPGSPRAHDIRVRTSLRGTLGYLPQMPEVGPC